MPLCGASGCGSIVADLKCAHCQGVFYCNGACQKADWRRHKPFCKPLPSSAAAPSSASTLLRQLKRGCVSSSKVDVDLFRVLYAFLHEVSGTPKRLRKQLPSVLKLAQTLLARGARPDVLIGITAADRPAQLSSCIACLCSAGCPGMEPLLELFLTAECTPSLDLDAASEPESGVLRTPMFSAIARHQLSFVQLLLAHGADVRAPTALFADGRLVWPVRTCIGATWNSLAEQRTTDGTLEILDCLIVAGADVDAVDDRCFDDRPPDDTALLWALESSSVSVGRDVLDAVALRLIEAGANVHARDRFQRRPLDLAAELPSLDVFRALIAKGAELSPTPFIRELKHGSHRTGTHYLEVAAQNGRAEVLQAAADAGVKLKKVKSLGRLATPLLTVAAFHGHLSCVRVLLAAGADVNEVADAGRGLITACDAALDCQASVDEERSAQIVRVLRAAGGKCHAEV